MHFIVYMQIFMHKFAILLVFCEKLGGIIKKLGAIR